MGIDSMRVGGGRCPPLLIIGLIFTCVIVIFNWWTLSTENFDLYRQIDELNEQLKISAEERDQCVTLRSNVEQRYKHVEDEVASLHVKLEQQNDLRRKNDELDDSLNICKRELDSLNKLDATKTATLETLRLEKDNFNTQLDVKRDENKKLQQEVEQLKDELDKTKLSCTPTLVKRIGTIEQPTRPVINKSQLGPVPASAVKISLAGQRGLKYHGIPILPKDPPGAVRLSPRYSVSMLKAETDAKEQKNNESNDGMPNAIDPDNSKPGNTGTMDEIESDRDLRMKEGTTEDNR